MLTTSNPKQANEHTYRQAILSNLDQPGELEAMYRANGREFREAFFLVFPEVSDNIVARVWNERLGHKEGNATPLKTSERIALLLMIALAGAVARIPVFFGLNEESFYQRNLSLILIPSVMGYFIWKNNISDRRSLIPIVILVAAAAFVNLLPATTQPDILLLTGLHLPLFLWFWTGFAFVGNSWRETEIRMQFIRFNGDWIVMSTILAITGGLITAITVGLFDLIDINLEIFLQDYAGYWLVPAIPLLAAVMVMPSKNMVSKVAPVVSRIITPLVIVILFAYLAAMMFSGTSPYTDREFLIIFNVVLISVMALISFTTIAPTGHGLSRTGKIQLISLALLALIVNVVALSAIAFRIAEWGMTPNRFAVLGSNVLIMIHLIFVAATLMRSLNIPGNDLRISRSMVSYIPVYMIWTAVVTFLFPLFSALSSYF